MRPLKNGGKDVHDRDISGDSYEFFETEKTHRGVFILAAGVTAALIWSWATTLTGVTQAAGTVVSPKENQIIQHLEGGIVSRILVKSGEKVVAGQVLLELEDTIAAAELKMVQAKIISEQAALARIEAQLSNAEALDLKELSNASDNQQHLAILRAEMELFALNVKLQSETEASRENEVRQRQSRLSGLARALVNQNETIALISTQVDNVRRMEEIGAASKSELLQLLRVLQEAKAILDDLKFQSAEAKDALENALADLHASRTNYRAKLMAEKSSALLRIAQAEQTEESLMDRSRRSKLRAPVDGTVQRLLISTEGGVVSAGQPIAQIVPETDTILIEARLPPSERAKIWPGTKAVVKISAYDYSVYGGIQAQVTDISPDVMEAGDGTPYFRVILSAPKLLDGRYPIVPGMMATVNMETSNYTVLQYIMSPLINTVDVALRQ